MIKTLLNMQVWIQSLSNENIEIVPFDNYDTLMKEINNNNIQYGITYENYFIDAVLGLNSYENKIYKNLQFCTGLYFNYFQLLSNVFIKDDEFSSKFNKISDFKNFKKIYNRNLVIGTEDFKSISFINFLYYLLYLILILINYSKFDYTKEYNDNDVFYLIDTEENLTKKMLENKIDALFLFRTFNDKTVNYIDSEKDIIYVDIDFETTYFDQLFSIYYFKNNNILIGVDSIDDLVNKIGFQTKNGKNNFNITNNNS